MSRSASSVSTRASLRPARRVAGGDEQRRVADHLGHRAGGGRDAPARRPASPRAVAARSPRSATGTRRPSPPQQRGALVVAHPADAADAVGVPCAREGLGQRLGAPAVGTGDHESHRVVGIRGRRRRRTRAPARGGPCAARPCRARRTYRAAPASAAPRAAPVAGPSGGSGVTPFGTVTTRAGGIRVLGPRPRRPPTRSPCGPSAAPHRAGDQTGVGARVAVGQLGEAPRGQVVDGDDPRRPPGRAGRRSSGRGPRPGSRRPLDRWEVGRGPSRPAGDGPPSGGRRPARRAAGARPGGPVPAR